MPLVQLNKSDNTVEFWESDGSNRGKVSLADIESIPSVSAITTTSKVSVGAASTAVLAANSDRQFAVFVNDSDEVIYLNLSATAVMNEGIRLNANGGSYEINLLNLYTGAVTGICSSGTKNLTVTEG